jgi:hypothetical protein
VKIRTAAEDNLTRITQETLRKVEDQEAQIRQQTEFLWSKFREASDRFESEKRDILRNRKRESGKWASATMNLHGANPSTASPGSTVSVRDFVPSHVSPQRSSMSPGSVTPRTSALSASLAASSFHHPRYKQSQESLHYSSSKHSGSLSQNQTPHSPSTGSSRTLTYRKVESEMNDILEPSRGDADESRNIAASLLVLGLEAEMERYHKQRLANSSVDNPRPADPSTHPEPSQTNTEGNERAPPPLSDKTTDQAIPLSPKKKRKVTFDQPDIVTMKRDVTKEAHLQGPDDSKGQESELNYCAPPHILLIDEICSYQLQFSI